MDTILQQITVSEYDEFKRLVRERLGWSRTQYNDKKNGRLKIHPLELRELQAIVDDLHKQPAVNTDVVNRVHCNAKECMLFEYNRCVFDTPTECPKYQ